MPQLEVEFRLRSAKSSEFQAKNTLLSKGEPAIEEDTLRTKIGDGKTRYRDLAYATYSPAELKQMIDDAIADLDLGGDGGGGTNPAPSDLIDHIMSTAPHPVYDDGPSLVLLYQNAKV